MNKKSFEKRKDENGLDVLVEVVPIVQEMKQIEQAKSGLKEQEKDLDLKMVNLNNEMLQHFELLPQQAQNS